MYKIFSRTQTVLNFPIRNETAGRLLKRCTMDIFNTKLCPRPEDLPKYEVIKDEKLWEYVERLLPQDTVPPVPKRKYYSSGWKPQNLNPDVSYFVRRSRNHMLPVYLKSKMYGQKKHTYVRHVHGDIHQMAQDLYEFVSKVNAPKKQCVKVIETSGVIVIHGDHVSDVKLWLEKRNF